MIFLQIGVVVVIMVLLFLVVSYVTIEIYASSRVFKQIEKVPSNEFCLVLGTSPTRKDGQPNRYFVRRMNAVVELYIAEKVSKIMLSGDKHRDYDEPYAMQKALEERNISKEVCILDGEGYDTIDSIIHAKNLLNTKSITIVSQDFHCERAVFLAGCLGVKAIAFAAEDVVPFWKSKTKFREIFARMKAFLDIFMIKAKKINIINIIPIRFPAPTINMRRKYDNGQYCIAHLYDGKTGEYICDAIEDTVRDENHNGIFDNGEKKIYGETAIPCGRYYVTFRRTGLTIGAKALKGLIPYVHDVPNFTNIRIHNGETEKDSEGCIILGQNKVKGKVLNSEYVCLDFYRRMRYRPFWLEITDDFK